LTIKFTRHTAACSRRDEQFFNCHPERSRGTCFPFGKTNPQQTTTRRANSMGLDPAHRTPRESRFSNPLFYSCYPEQSEGSAFWLAPELQIPHTLSPLIAAASGSE